MSEEIWDEKLTRVELMASGDETWDLSENDTAALAAVLKDRAYMESSWSTATREKHELMAALSEAQQENELHGALDTWAMKQEISEVRQGKAMADEALRLCVHRADMAEEQLSKANERCHRIACGHCSCMVWGDDGGTPSCRICNIAASISNASENAHTVDLGARFMADMEAELRAAEQQVAQQAATIDEHKSTYDTNLRTLAHNHRIEQAELMQELAQQAATISQLVEALEAMTAAKFGQKQAEYAWGKAQAALAKVCPEGI